MGACHECKYDDKQGFEPPCDQCLVAWAKEQSQTPRWEPKENFYELDVKMIYVPRKESHVVYIEFSNKCCIDCKHADKFGFDFSCNACLDAWVKYGISSPGWEPKENLHEPDVKTIHVPREEESHDLP